MKARFVRLVWENAAHTIGTVYCSTDKPYYFTAGQYADFTVPHDNPDKRGLTRTMTIVTLPSAKLVGFTTRFDRTIGTYKRALLDMQPGAILQITDPMGDLVLPLTSDTPLLFVAGGVAVASYVSMIRWLSDRQDARKVTLLYAVRNRSDIIFQDDFTAYAAIGNCNTALYTTDSAITANEWNGAIMPSRITAADIMQHTTNDTQIYLSGSEKMVEQLRHGLQRDYKVEQYRIAFDFYEGYSEL